MAMEKPLWVFGNEQRFMDFVEDLDGKEAVIVSHTDLDGIAAAKIINEHVKADKKLFVNYDELNETLVEKLKRLKPKKVIISDLFFKQGSRIISKIEKFADVLIIDHHSFDEDFNSSRTVHMNAQGFCATYLSYYLFSKVSDISHFDWLVACASIADVLYPNNQKFMQMVFDKYGDVFKITNDGQIRKDGKFWDLQWQLSLAIVAKDPNYLAVFDAILPKFVLPEKLSKDVEAVQEEYNSLMNRFEKEKELINGRYIWEFSPRYKLTGLISSAISFTHSHATCIFISPLGEGYKFSARRQDGGEDLNILSANLVKGFENSAGGGHKKAAGGNFPKKYLQELKKRLEIL